MNHVVRGSIEWAGTSALHLTPAQKRFCNRAKEEIIRSQQGRKMIRAPYEDGHFPRAHYIESLSQMKGFVEDCLEIIRKGPTVVVMDTRGSSDRWLDKRRELDGERFRKNEESSGVTAILLKVLVRGHGGHFWLEHGEGPMAFINMQLIVERDMDGKPSVPPSFLELLRHQNSIITGENVVKHLKRIENSFAPQLVGVFIVTSEDLVNRWEEKLRVAYWEGKAEYEFDLDPFVNSGLLASFHRVSEETFFRNPYEAAPALWDDISAPRISQVAHALNKVFFGEMMLRRVLKYFMNWDMSLAVMCQVYPEIKKVTREDGRMKMATEAFRDSKPRIQYDREGLPTHSSLEQSIRNWWFEETEWPSKTAPANRRVREEQAETRRKRRRTDPYFREQREYAVSDDEDADEALRAVRASKARAVGRGKKLAETISVDEKKDKDRICDPKDGTRLSDLARLDEDDDPLFFATLLKNLDWGHETRAIKLLFSFYAGRESEAMKEAVLNTVAAEGFFKKSSSITAFQAMQRMDLKQFHPSTLLQMPMQSWILGEFVAQLPICTRLDVINYFCEYFGLTYDERHIQLEGCDFYFRGNRAFYLKKTQMIEQALLGVCAKCGVPPVDGYFRTKRRFYINDVIEEGRQGRIGIDNAVQMIAAQVGDDRWSDAKDAVTMAGPWPKVAEHLSKKFELSGSPPTMQRVDDNLAVKVKCRLELHEYQTDIFLRVLRELSEVEAMRVVMAEAGVVQVSLYENRDPRAFSDDPQLIAFTSPNCPTYAYFPVSISGDPRRAIGDFLRTKTLMTRKPGAVKRHLAGPNQGLRIANGSELLMEHTGGRDNESLMDFLWSKRFCSLTIAEWMIDPLTVKQSFHVVYLMDAMREFMEKIGVEAIESVAKVVRSE